MHKINHAMKDKFNFLTIEPLGWSQSDKKLASIGVWTTEKKFE